MFSDEIVFAVAFAIPGALSASIGNVFATAYVTVSANHFWLSEKIRLLLRDPNLVVQAFEMVYARKSGLPEEFHFF